MTMFKADEFSFVAQIDPARLDYYDEIGLLKPKTDSFTDIKQYTLQQLDDLKRIEQLKSLGFNACETAIALQNTDREDFLKALDKKREEIEAGIKKEKNALLKIALVKKDALSAHASCKYGVNIKNVPSFWALCLRNVVSAAGSEQELWKKLLAYAEENSVTISGAVFTVLHGNSYKESDLDMEVCLPVALPGKNDGDFVFRRLVPVSDMACILIRGHYDDFKGPLNCLARYLDGHEQYKTAGQMRLIYHRGPWNEKNVSNHLTELQIPLKSR